MSGLLVLTAHPDDEALIAGGVLAGCAAAGLPTAVACLTRGEEGPVSDPRLLEGRSLAEVRLGELRAACAELGVAKVRCFRRRDSELLWARPDHLAAQLARLIAGHAPAAIVTFGADGLYGHDDHIVVHRVTRRALAGLGRDAPRLYEAAWPASLARSLTRAMRRRGLPSDLWGIPPSGFGAPASDDEDLVEVDVRPFVAAKLRALRRHRTQLGPDHLLSALPDDLAERHLGVERFRRVGPAPGRDWLTVAVGEGAAASRV